MSPHTHTVAELVCRCAAAFACPLYTTLHIRYRCAPAAHRARLRCLSRRTPRCRVAFHTRAYLSPSFLRSGCYGGLPAASPPLLHLPHFPPSCHACTRTVARCAAAPGALRACIRARARARAPFAALLPPVAAPACRGARAFARRLSCADTAPRCLPHNTRCLYASPPFPATLARALRTGL